MANSIATAEVFQKQLDRQLLEGATSGWMEENGKNIVYNGGKSIKIPSLSLQGLALYSRTSGYLNGNVNFSYASFQLTQDRGRRFVIDAMDVDETNFALTAAEIVSEFQKTKVIPEVDAYRYSMLYAISEAGDMSKEYTPNADTVFDELMGQISDVSDVIGCEDQLMVSIARPVYDLLMRSPQAAALFENLTVKQGEADINIKRIGNANLIPVPTARFYTKIEQAEGGDGGYSKAADGSAINWIISPRSAPMAFSKTDTVRMIPPELNQNANAWIIDYRKFHDVFVTQNQWKTIASSVQV